MGEIKSKLPIQIVGIKTKSTSEGGIKYIVDNNQEHSITPILPGEVIKVDGDKVVISHKDYVNEDYVSIYKIDGKVKVKKGDDVSQSSVIGKTDKDVELKVKYKGNFIDSKGFIGKSFNQTKGREMSARQRAECMVKNLINLPSTALGYKDKNDPCSTYNEKDTNSEPDDVEDDKDKKDEEPKNDKWEFFNDDEDDEKDNGLLGTGTKLLGGETTEKLNEEISRIKELLKLWFL